MGGVSSIMHNSESVMVKVCIHNAVQTRTNSAYQNLMAADRQWIKKCTAPVCINMSNRVDASYEISRLQPV